VFRRDRYGQLRDMMEQRPFTRYHLAGKLLESAVVSRFFDVDGNVMIPSDTFTQNLSPYSTSSLPYFDGVVRNRTDNPDLKYTETVEIS
jgi:hypothetical protein